MPTKTSLACAMLGIAREQSRANSAISQPDDLGGSETVWQGAANRIDIFICALV
jgi:hypothetical protein